MIRIIKIILSTLGLLFVIYVVWVISFGYNFTGDVYQDSEEYIVEQSKDDLINIIETFRSSNPSYKLITTNEEGEYIYYQDSNSSKHYNVYFYFKDIDLTIKCLLDYINEDESRFSLYAVSKGVNFASWKTINTKELTRKENKEIKKKFEKEILDNLGSWKRDSFFNW